MYMLLLAVAQAGAVFFLAQRKGLWPLAVALVVAVELWRLRPGGPLPSEGKLNYALDRVPVVAVGVGVAVIVAVAPRLATQIVACALYGWWKAAWRPGKTGFMSLLLVQGLVFESVFMTAAVWRMPHWLVLALVWLGAYVVVYAFLARRNERAAGVLAAAWALICAQISWVLLLWLFTYAMSGGYLLIPQPALILTALAYCFGSIYLSQRQGTLTRGRLTEYLVIGLIMIAIVVVGTSWRGTI